MRVCVISANLGAYDQPHEWPQLVAPPGVTVEIHRFTDANFPPRPLAMTSRLQCGIPKWFGSDFAPDADVIVWIDASCTPTPIAVQWFLDKLGKADIAVFTHPDRKTVREEYEFMTRKLAEGNRYLTSRYRGEWLDEQFRKIDRDGYADARLFASTAFAYRNRWNVGAALREVFLWKARYHLHDQLALAAVLAERQAASIILPRVAVSVIQDNYLKCPALQYVRNRK